MNIWGFHRITTGPNKGGYTHKYFVRSKEELCCMMSRQKIKSGKPAKPRPYFPIRANMSTSGENREVDINLNCISLENQALNTMLAKDPDELTLPISRLTSNNIPSNKHNYEDNAQKGMLPFNCDGVSSNPMAMLVPSIDCSDQVPESTSFADNAGIASQRGVESFPMRTISPLPFLEGCCVLPNLGTTNINDEKLTTSNFPRDLGTMMPFLSPDPIAPDHPLSKQPQRNNDTTKTNTSFNRAISNMIDILVNNTPAREEVQQEDNSLFEGRNFFSLGERPERRSSLGS